MVAHHPNARTFRTSVPTAQQVYLVGDFNNWSTTATPLQHVADGTWEVTLQRDLEVRKFCFFVWERGEAFGRILHPR